MVSKSPLFQLGSLSGFRFALPLRFAYDTMGDSDAAMKRRLATMEAALGEVQAALAEAQGEIAAAVSSAATTASAAPAAFSTFVSP